MQWHCFQSHPHSVSFPLLTQGSFWICHLMCYRRLAFLSKQGQAMGLNCWKVISFCKQSLCLGKSSEQESASSGWEVGEHGSRGALELVSFWEIMTKSLWEGVNLKSHKSLNKARLDTLASITNRNDGTEFGGSIYQKVNNKVETSINLAWTAGSNNTRFGIAAKYQMNEKTSIVVRILLQEWVFRAPVNTENLCYEVVQNKN